MGEILSSEEIDSLLAKAKETAPSPKRKPRRIPKKAVESFKSLHGSIIESLSANFRVFFGLEASVQLSSFDEMTFCDFINSISKDTPLFAFEAQGSEGRIYLNFEPSFSVFLVEALTGGAGIDFPCRYCRGTRFERSLFEITSRRISDALGPVLGRKLYPGSSSLDSGEPCVLALYEVKTSSICGFFSICFTESTVIALKARDKQMPIFGNGKSSGSPSRLDEPASRLSVIFDAQGGEALRKAIVKEHPQTISLLMALAPDEAAAGILENLSPDTKTEVAARFARLGAVSPGILWMLLDAMTHEIGEMEILEALCSGKERLAKILRITDLNSEKTVLECMGEYDGALAAELRNSLFLFEDLILLDEGSVRAILELADGMDLRMALRDTSTALQEHIYKSMPRGIAEQLRDDMAYSGPVRLSLVQEAQRRISEIAIRLNEEGKIRIPPRSDSKNDAR